MKYDLSDYIAACDYPGKLDSRIVTNALKEYCVALGVIRNIVKLAYPWWRQKGLLEYIIAIARNARNARNAMNAIDAIDAMNARNAMNAIDANAMNAMNAIDAIDAIDAR